MCFFTSSSLERTSEQCYRSRCQLIYVRPCRARRTSTLRIFARLFDDRKGGKGKESSGAETRKCHECGQVGHIRRDCPTQKISVVDETTQPNQVGAVFETAEHAWIFAL